MRTDNANTSLGEVFPKQQERLRQLRADVSRLPIQSRWFYIAQLDALLERSECVVISGDAVQMLAVYTEMAGFES